MTDNSRIPMYGAQHPLYLIKNNNDKKNEEIKYVVVGSCCESGDLITCARNEPEILNPTTFKKANIGDLMVMGGVGAYCSSMSVFNYNSKQRSPEYLVRTTGKIDQVRKKQKLEEVWCDDIIPQDI